MTERLFHILSIIGSASNREEELVAGFEAISKTSPKQLLKVPCSAPYGLNNRSVAR